MEVWARTRELLNSLTEVTESGTRMARYKIEVANLDRKLTLAFRRIGERAWQLETEARTDVLGDPEVRAAFDDVRRMRARMEVIRQDLVRHRGRAEAGVSKAARAVRDEAARVVKKVSSGASRAGKAAKGKAGSRKKAARRR